MASLTFDANLSDLLNKPKATLARLADNRRLVLHRRDAEDLVLTTASQAEADTAVVRYTSRLFTEMMRKDPMVMSLAIQVLPSIFPWSRHLPDDAKEEFTAEWIATLSAAAEMNNNAAVETTIASWRSTAEVYADPELYSILTREHNEDYGPVPMPEVPE
jgi:hypothetical protein